MKKILFGLAIIAGLTACGGEQKKEEPKKVESKGKLLFYAGLQEDHAALVAQEFEKETGIKTEFVRLSSGETLARLKAEKNNMTASVWYGGPVDGMVAGAEEGLVEPYKSPEAANIRDEFKDPNGIWTGIYVGYLGFVGNKKVLEEKKLAMPASWSDLLKPEYKGEIVVAHPGSSGTAYTMLASLVQLMGEEQAMDYMKKFNEQVRQYTKSGTAPGRMVGTGEATVGITFLHDGIKYQKEGYTDIVLGAPSEGTGFEIGGVALLKGGPDQSNAKKFIDWALTKKTQELGKTVGSFQFLTNKNAVNPEEAKVVENTKLIKYDFDWAGKNKKRLVERFTKETNATVPKE